MVTQYGGTVLTSLPIIDLIEQETKKLIETERNENEIKNRINSPARKKAKIIPKHLPDPPTPVMYSIPFLNPLPVNNDMFVGRLSENVFLLSKPTNFRRPNYLLAHATGTWVLSYLFVSKK
jgi:hypothetical protein